MYSLKKIFLPILCFVTLPIFGFSPITSKEHMLRDLDHIQEIFSVKYAPLRWKEEYKGWNLEEEIALAKAKVRSLNNPNIKELQRITKTFFDSAADYHVGVTFYSLEASFLHFSLKSAEGRYFIVDINRNKLPLSRFPFAIGDEILSFNGIDIAAAIEDFKASEFTGGNTPASEQALAENEFTQRFGALGYTIPRGQVSLTGKNKNGAIRKATITWDYREEKIDSPGNRNFVKALPSFSFSKQKQEKDEIRNFFNHMMLAPFWREGERHASPHGLGGRKSFLAELGKPIWKSDSEDTFDAYIFKSPKGATIGYIRIADYMGDEEEAEEFRTIIEMFKNRTDALLIDQLNNPGGSVYYLYALASMLTDKPLTTPKHHIALTQDNIHLAMTILRASDYVSDDASAQVVFGENFGGYAVNYKFAKLVFAHCHFLIDEWNKGALVTSPTHLIGVNDIEPHPKTRYTKPILFLINALDFSGGDFLPAILQDNGRALIVGERTAGAGGFVLENTFYNLSGINQFKVTGSLAVRKDGAPIENLGVQPDIELLLTPYDMQNQYIDYKKSLLSTLDHIVLSK